MSSLRLEARKLGANSLVYLLPSIVVRGLSFLLTPVYTRYLSPAEYGVFGFGATVTVLLATVLGFALQSSITRLHFECTDEHERRGFYGTLLVFYLVVPTALTLLLQALGSAGLLEFFRIAPFRPYLQLAVWSAYLSIFPTIPTTIFATREEPARVAALNVVVALLQTSAMVYFVVLARQGALGALRAPVAANAIAAVVAIALWLRHAELRFVPAKFWAALSFSVPVIPHLVSNWVLSISDRMILEPHVTAAALGLYSLGYTFNLVVGMVAGAIASALGPIIVRRLKIDPKSRDVPRLGTAALTAITMTSLGVAAFGGDAIRWLTPVRYHGAAAVVPWVVLGAAFQGLYLIWSQGTWFSMRTGVVPIVTGLAAAANVGLNLVFVPRFGIMAAAVNTAVAYGLMALLHGAVAHYVFPIAWEYRRWGVVLGAALGGYIACSVLEAHAGIVLATAGKLAIVCVVYPAALIAGRVVTLNELRTIRR